MNFTIPDATPAAPEGWSLPTGVLGTAGLLGALALSTRIPAVRGLMQRAAKGAAERLPSELQLTREATAKLRPLISETERFHVGRAETAAALERAPWMQEARRMKRPQVEATTVAAEAVAQQEYLALVKAGTPHEAAVQQSVAKHFPNFLQGMHAWRESRLPLEHWARDTLAVSDFSETALGAYIPRLVERDVLRVRGGEFLGRELRESLGRFAESRIYPTMEAGIREGGVKYADPRVAMVYREVVGMNLVETARYIERLEQGGILHRTREAAIRAGGKAIPIEGVPGRRTWFAGTDVEAKFIVDNLSSPESRFGFLNRLANSLARNPNLVNPYPHFLKNMLYKYGLSGANLGRAHADMQEFRAAATPLAKRFNAVMPFGKEPYIAEQTMGRLLADLRTEGDVTRPFVLALRSAEKLNEWSARKVFTDFDPGLRFSRWKQYVAKGMTDVEAANHTWVDLVRYGTRSDAVDFWKGLPLNFFVPWRLGTVTSLVKQAMSHPIRAALFVGAVDYLREVRYRQTGRWTHLPIDYIEMPIAKLLQAKSPSEFGVNLLSQTTLTMLFGPGGASSAAQIADVINDVRGRGEYGRLLNMFWGIASLGGALREMYEFAVDGQTRHLTNTLTSLALAEHNALAYRPRRLGEFLSERLPGMARAPEVRLAEQMQEAREQRRGQYRERRGRLPTIEERIERIRALTGGG